jgi:PadR family transcriptional regulator
VNAVGELVGVAEQIERKLADRFRLLSGSRTAVARQRTLEATVDWTLAVVISPTMWFKNNAPTLGDFEQLVLLGVARLELQESAYGAAIRQEIHARSGRDVSINAVYTTLDRLENKGFLKSWVGEPTPQRGGRRRKFYALRPAGVAALRQAYRAVTAMADGLQSRLALK